MSNFDIVSKYGFFPEHSFLYFSFIHNIYIYQDSNLIGPVFYFAEPVYGSFGKSNVHSTLDFCPRLARKDMNVLLKSF